MGGDGVTTYLFTQGVLGVVVIALGIVCIKLYNKTERLESRIQQIQDLRVQETKDVSKDLTEVLQGNSQSNRILAEKIEVAKNGGKT